MNIKGGYILQPRIIEESDIAFAPPHVREIWSYLLRNANSSFQKYKGFEISRGQLFRNYQDIRDALSWNIGYRKERYSEDQTKKAMKFLRDTLRITTTKAPGGVLITICNYEYYQDPKNYESTNGSTSESTNAAPMPHQCGTTNNKNDKNDKNDKEDITVEKFKQVFDEFRKAYPGTKRGLETEFKNFKKHTDYKQVVFELNPALQKLINWRKESEKNGSFVPQYPMLQTWINQRRWEEELEIIKEGSTKKIFY